ncbi:hypothetical protein UFOVP434_17 [uncultured Caudovirales phage]|uniref:Uncharacterized protein n=1 Tax=uncultured Caudovirales phage TaxID=2100421 RepID=A0A6J5M780_9CAUD|nr:hypothetical protein UFOVP434_17 [uncultured Caudovirales phage]
MPKLILEKTDEVIDDLLEGFAPWEIISQEITDKGRWSIHYELVVKNLETGKVYKTYYSVGATECQDEGPWENDSEIELHECVAKEKVIIEYEIIR